MTEQLIGLLAPPLNFSGTSESSTAAKRTMRLRDMVPAGMTLNADGSLWLPTEAKIKKILLWNQMGGEYPGTTGDVSLTLDYAVDGLGPVFVKDSGFPLEERCWFGFGSCLGKIEFRTGRDHGEWTYNDPAIIVGPDDLFCFAPEANGGGSLQVFANLGLVSETRPRLMPGVVFRSQMNLDCAGNPALSLRSLIPNTTPGTEIRARISTWGSGLSSAYIGVGAQSGSGPNMLATPVPLKLAGNALISQLAWRSEWTDWSPFVQSGVPLVIDSTLVGTSGNNTWAISINHLRSSWYSLGVDSHTSASLSGSVVEQSGPNGRTHVIDCVQVR